MLATWAVGMGIIWESNEYDASTHRVARRLVLIGIAVETLCSLALFVFDEGVSHAQQSKIIALETKIAPRNLEPSDIEDVGKALLPYTGTHFDLAVTQEIEPMRLLDKVEDALKKAGWIEEPADPRATHFNRIGRSAVAVRTMAGVWILYPATSEAQRNAASALVGALRVKHIDSTEIRITEPTQFDFASIHVWIGGKP